MNQNQPVASVLLLPRDADEHSRVWVVVGLFCSANAMYVYYKMSSFASIKMVEDHSNPFSFLNAYSTRAIMAGISALLNGVLYYLNGLKLRELWYPIAGDKHLYNIAFLKRHPKLRKLTPFFVCVLSFFVSLMLYSVPINSGVEIPCAIFMYVNRALLTAASILKSPEIMTDVKQYWHGGPISRGTVISLLVVMFFYTLIGTGDIVESIEFFFPETKSWGGWRLLYFGVFYVLPSLPINLYFAMRGVDVLHSSSERNIIYEAIA